jgi:hypothetical protein
MQGEERLIPYCRCGHLLTAHVGDELSDGPNYCLACDCAHFAEVPAEEADEYAT